MPNSKASLSFLEAGRAAGNASCNRFTGASPLTGKAIKFGQMASTRMACADEAVSAQENQYLKLLGEANRYEVKDNSLLIYVEIPISRCGSLARPASNPSLQYNMHSSSTEACMPARHMLVFMFY